MALFVDNERSDRGRPQHKRNYTDTYVIYTNTDNAHRHIGTIKPQRQAHRDAPTQTNVTI